MCAYQPVTRNIGYKALCQIHLSNAQTSGGTVLTLDKALLLASFKQSDLKLYGLDVGKTT